MEHRPGADWTDWRDRGDDRGQQIIPEQKLLCVTGSEINLTIFSFPGLKMALCSFNERCCLQIMYEPTAAFKYLRLHSEIIIKENNVMYNAQTLGWDLSDHCINTVGIRWC